MKREGHLEIDQPPIINIILWSGRQLELWDASVQVGEEREIEGRIKNLMIEAQQHHIINALPS